MTIYISPNPGKTSASEIALRAAQILLTHGAAVLMSDALRESCNTAVVIYLPLERCLKRADVILTIGGDGTILHEANLSLRYAKPILGINLGRCGFLATCEIGEMKQSWPLWRGAISSWTTGCFYTPGCLVRTAGRTTHSMML